MAESAHPSEPLARTRTVIPGCESGYQSEIHIGVDVPFSTEVEVRPAGSHPTVPTREQVHKAINGTLNRPGFFQGTWSRTPSHYVDAAVDAVMALFSGSEETTDGRS